MSKRITFEEFLVRAKALHGDKYKYHRETYRGSREKTTITCPVHGDFEQVAGQHAIYGCFKCGRDLAGALSRTPFNALIDKFKRVHGDLYEYDLEGYKSSLSPIKIKCQKHGWFKQVVGNHLSGSGCFKCGRDATGKKRLASLEQVIAAFREVHGNTYDYSKVKYKGNKKKVEIICREHGSFFQSPVNHTRKRGCPKCKSTRLSKVNTLSSEQIISDFRAVHEDKYDYSEMNYVSVHTKIAIRCPLHGEFRMTPAGHKRGSRCPECHRLEQSSKQIKCSLEVEKDFRLVHGDKYDYSQMEYYNAKQIIKIICPVHGLFFQDPSNHLAGKGCPACSRQESKPEREVVEFLEQLGLVVQRRDRELIAPKELDIVLPELKLAIEYNGLIWHSERFKQSTEKHHNPARRHMIEKQLMCKEKGYRLIHINSNEDLTVVKRTLAVITGADDERIFARKCKVEKLTDKDQIDNFLNKYHVQGTVTAKPYTYGLTYYNQLVAVMVFSPPVSRRGIQTPGHLELRRYSSLCRVVGGASRLLKAFLRDVQWAEKIFSYSDNRWFTGKMYEALGFKEHKVSSPDYQYISGGSLFPKNHFTRARMAKMRGFNFDPTKSERENTWNNGYYRVWDCGKTSWILNCQSKKLHT